MKPPALPRPPLLAAALLHAAVALVCTRLPLLNTLGYEFSALVAFLASLTAGLGTAGYLSRAAAAGDRVWTPVLLARAVAGHLAVLAIPFVVMTANALFVRNCSFRDGVLYFLLLPAVSVWFSAALGAFCAMHYRRSRTIFLGLVALSLASVLARGYWTPAVFAYDPFFGYFPGFTHDEALEPDRVLALFRLLTVFLGGVIAWMALLLASEARTEDSVGTKGRRLLAALVAPGRVVVTAIAAAVFILVVLYRGELGFDAPADFVRRELGGVYETPHVTIVYPPGALPGGLIRETADDHEWRLHQVVASFPGPPPGRITSYLYSSAEQKRRLIGAGGTDIAKPWLGEMHLQIPGLAGTLKHELVHVIAAPYGLPLAGISASPGLVEGLAMAVEWDWGNRTLHRYAAAMRAAGAAADVRRLMDPLGFVSQTSAVGYVTAGSFVRFLIDRYGMESVLRVYGAASYGEAFGKDLDALATEWERFLAGEPVEVADREAVRALFGGRPLIRKVCARVIAARNRSAAKLFAQREYTEAARLYAASWRETGDDEAFRGYVASALPAGEIAPVLVLRDSARLRGDTHTPAVWFSFGLASRAAGDTAGARALFSRVVRDDISETYTEAALIQLLALEDTVNGAALLRYYLSREPDTLRLRALGAMVRDTAAHWLPLYLHGRLLAGMRRREEAVRVLGRLGEGERHPRLDALRWRTVGAALYRLGRTGEAADAFAKALRCRDDEVWRLRIGEWIERCAWKAAGGGV